MNFRKRMLVCLAVVAGAFTAAIAQMMPPLPTDPAVRIGKLDNGLTYYIRHNAEPKDRAYFYIAQKVGSVQEEESQRGLAHFLEHMCFNGTKNFPGNSLIQWLESIGVKFGAELNAYTSTDETVYNIDAVPVTPGNVDSCLLILHDWADGLLLEDKEIDKERGVIHEEWRLRSSASGRILERNLENLYPGSRYGRRYPIGLMSVIDGFKYKELRDYYEKWYRPDHQGIIVVGDINVDEVEGKIKRIFGDIAKPATASIYEHYPVPANNEPIYVIDKDKEQQQGIVQIFFKHDPIPAELRGTQMFLLMNYANELAASAINARFAELSQQPDCPFLAAQVGDGNYIMSKTQDAFMLFILPKPGQDVAAVEAAFKEIQRAQRFGITETELLRAKEEYLSSAESDYNNRAKQKSKYYVPQYVRHFLEGNAIPDQETEYQLIKAIAQQLPLATASQLFQEYTAKTDTNFVFLAMYPEKEGVTVPTVEAMKQAIENAKTAKLEAYVDNVKNEPLVPTLPKAGKIKKSGAADFGYTCLELSNGARVFYKKTDFNESQISFGARSYGGLFSVKDADLLNARMMSEAVNAGGWGNFNSTELQKALAGKQAGVSVGLSQYFDELNGFSTPKDLRTLFELIYLHFQAPANDVDAYNNLMAMQRTALANADKVPETALRDSVINTLYANSPYVKPFKLADLDRVSYPEIRRIYGERFGNANDFDFYFTGALNEDSVRAFAEQYIASLPAKGKREVLSKKTLNILPGEKMNRFERKMETPKSYIYQVWSGPNKYTMKDAAVADMLGQILDQRYLKSIREEGSMAYSVGASVDLSYQGGERYTAMVQVPCKPAKIDSALILLDQGIQEIAKDGVTKEEMDKVLQYNLKTYTDVQRSNDYWEGLITAKNYWNRDNHTGYEAVLRSVTSDDVRNFVKNVLLKQRNLRTIIMQPADFKE